MFELTVSADSPLGGMSLGEPRRCTARAAAGTQTGTNRVGAAGGQRIWVGSVLGVMGGRQTVHRLRAEPFLRMSTRLREFATCSSHRAGIPKRVPPNSRFTARTRANCSWQQFGIACGGQPRQGVLRDNVRNLPLRAGDMLVLHSIWTDLAQTAASRDFVVVTDYPKGEQRPHKFKIAMVIFALTMLLALSSRIPASIALMAGVAGMLVTGVLKMDEAYTSINWKTVFLMACLIPLGWAMDSSGAAAWVAGHSIERLPEGVPTWVLQVAVGLLTSVFSLVISHVGATIVMVPMAINLALAVGGDPTSFALIVALSASNNFMTASNPVMSMITGPAGYTARELWRVGAPLSLIYMVIAVLAVNLLF